MLPKDPAILLSYVNTQLRDYYPSLEEMCKSLDIRREDVITALAGIQYEYDESVNQFI
jgi:O-succinylbenzoate synthase